MSSRELITTEKSDDRKLWKLDMLAESAKTVFEKNERIDRSDEGSSFSSLPDWLVQVLMREKDSYDPKLIIVRKLFPSDLNKGQSRLSLPINQVVNSDFLTEEETRTIYEQSELKTHREGVRVVLVDPLLKKHVVDLRKWKIGGSWNYVLVDGWNDVVAHNRFRADDVTRIWSFRYGGGKLGLALSPPVRDYSRLGRRSSRRS